MHLSTTLLTLLATSAAAYQDLNLLLARRTAPISPRQTSDASSCLSGLMEAVADAPRPPAAIQDAMMSYVATATQTDADYVCGWQTNLPSSLQSVYSSYQSKAMEWYTSNEAKISSAMEKCPPEYRTQSGAGVCTKGGVAGSPAPAGATPTGSSGASGSGGSGGSGSGSGGSNKNAAAGQGGILGPAAAVAAVVVGVAAAL